MAGEVGNVAKKFTRIPAKWKNYSACGKVIPDERLISFKTPLSEKYHCTGNESDPEDCLKKEEEFTPTDLCEIFQKRSLILGLVVDFTNTKRYYEAKEFTDRKIEYKKIKCEGKIVPPEKVVHRFKATILSFFKKYPNSDSVVGIHCTHGLNRAGYIVCRYLIECRGYSPKDAIEAFNKARGHEMERENYLEDLLQRTSKILSEPEDIDHLIKTSPPSDDEYQPDRFWNRDYSDGKRGYRHGKFNHRREYPDNHHGHRNFRHGYRDTHAPFRTAMQEPHHGYTRGKRGYQRTSKDYYSEPQDYSSGYDGDVYEDERVAGCRSERETWGYQRNEGYYAPHMDDERLSYDEGQRYKSDHRHDSQFYSGNKERFHGGERRRQVHYRRQEDNWNTERHRYPRYRDSPMIHDESDNSNYRERDDRDSRRMRNRVPSRDYR